WPARRLSQADGLRSGSRAEVFQRVSAADRHGEPRKPRFTESAHRDLFAPARQNRRLELRRALAANQAVHRYQALAARSQFYILTMASRAIFALLAISCAAPLTAHDLFRSESRLTVNRREVHAQFTFNLLDFAGVDQNGDKRVSQQEFDAAFDR